MRAVLTDKHGRVKDERSKTRGKSEIAQERKQYEKGKGPVRRLERGRGIRGVEE